MSAERQHKQEWIEQKVESILEPLTDGPTLAVLTGAYMVAEAAWKKHCEDGPDEMPNRDLGVWDLARCDGGMR